MSSLNWFFKFVCRNYTFFKTRLLLYIMFWPHQVQRDQPLCYPLDLTLTLYKVTLKECHKGTGGETGLSTLFERLPDAKLSCHNIYVDSYNNMDMANRPDILIKCYCK